MGAHSDYRIYKPEPRKGKQGKGALKTERELQAEVKEMFNRDQEEARNYYGHQEGYCGSIGQLPRNVRFIPRVFDKPGEEDSGWYTTDRETGEMIPVMKPKAQAQAEDYLEDNAGKKDTPMAVPFLYSPGKGKKRRKGYVVGGLCAS